MARSIFGKNGEPRSETDEQGTTPGASAKTDPPPRRKPIIKGGAASSKYINAATQGGADRTYQEVPVDQIQESLIRDRIDIEENLESLIESIRENGQQIPILVRIVQGDKPYEIVVGRRRLAAHRRLGMLRIKAFVAKLDDREAFVAQGIENSARLETSFIERARAAAQAIGVGYNQKDVSDFLSISRTLINFMVRTYETIGEDLVLAIGPARGIGRRKWDGLVKVMAKNGITSQDALSLVNLEISDSSDRFEALLKKVQTGVAKPHSKPPAPVDSDRQDFFNGGITTLRKPQRIVVSTRKSIPPEILDKIHSRIREFVEELEKEQEENDVNH